MDSSVLKYIHQRMDEMGYDGFHFEPVRVSANSASTQVSAYNVYYYLTSPNVPASLVILSDTNVFNEAAAYNNFDFYRVQEFSGLIEISQAAAPIELEFIRVVPQCRKREESGKESENNHAKKM